MSPYTKGSILIVAGIVALGWIADAALSEERLPVAPTLVVSSPYVYVEERLQRNETLSHLFGRHNIVGPELARVLVAADGLRPSRVRAGEAFEFKYLTKDTIPIEISHRLRDAEEFLIVRRDTAGNWIGLRQEIEWTAATYRVAGAITSSLWNAFPDAIPDSVLPARERNRLFINLTDDIYGWDIDFTYDIRQNDRFNVLFERLESSEGDIRYGRLLAARIETGGRPHSTYLLPGESGNNEYYDDQGRSMRRAFLRAPVSARVSSRFSLSRVHPILRVRRAHRGTDYAAGAGTAVHATGAGTVIHAGRDGGYGIVVKIRHASGIETRYAHLSRLAQGVRQGVRVDQDRIIGYVGMTGLATAPHVHYEFIKNGRYLNPTGVDLGDGEPVPQSRREEFERIRTELDLILDGGPQPAISLR